MAILTDVAAAPPPPLPRLCHARCANLACTTLTFPLTTGPPPLCPLTDDLVAFFERCKKGLKPGGYIVVKENVLATGEFWLDKDDSSVVRYDC